MCTPSRGGDCHWKPSNHAMPPPVTTHAVPASVSITWWMRMDGRPCSVVNDRHRQGTASASSRDGGVS